MLPKFSGSKIYTLIVVVLAGLLLFLYAGRRPLMQPHPVFYYSAVRAAFLQHQIFIERFIERRFLCQHHLFAVRRPGCHDTINPVQKFQIPITVRRPYSHILTASTNWFVFIPIAVRRPYSHILTASTNWFVFIPIAVRRPCALMLHGLLRVFQVLRRPGRVLTISRYSKRINIRSVIIPIAVRRPCLLIAAWATPGFSGAAPSGPRSHPRAGSGLRFAAATSHRFASAKQRCPVGRAFIARPPPHPSHR